MFKCYFYKIKKEISKKMNEGGAGFNKVLKIVIAFFLVFIVGMVIANHVAYKSANKDISEIVSKIEENGVDITYSLNYNIVGNMLLKEKIYLEDVTFYFQETEQDISVSKIGVGSVDLVNLNFQLSIDGLQLPIGVFYDESSMNPMVQSYFDAFKRIGIDAETYLETSFYINAVDNDGVLNLNTKIEIERLIGLALELKASGFNPVEFAGLMMMPVTNEDEFIQRQLAISNAYENISFDKINLNIKNKGLANAILIENKHMHGLDSIEESQTLMIGEFESIMKEFDLNPVMEILFKELIVFFSDV